MNNRAFIVSEKGFPERLCLFYIDDEQPHTNETIKLAIGNIHPLIDKAMLAQHDNIVRIFSITLETTAAEPTNIIQPRPRRRDKTRVVEIDGAQTITSTALEKATKGSTKTEAGQESIEPPPIKIQCATIGYGYIGNEKKKIDNNGWRENDSLTYHRLTPVAYASPEIIHTDITRPDGSSITINRGNLRNNPEVLIKRLCLDMAWKPYFVNGEIPATNHTNESVKDYCLNHHLDLIKLKQLKETLASVHPEIHRQALEKKHQALENSVNDVIESFIQSEDIPQKAAALNVEVNDAFQELNKAIEEANFGNEMAQLAYQKSTLIYHLQNAAEQYAKKITDDFATSENETPLEHFMKTAKHLDDNFHGIAYLDADMHFQRRDLSMLSLNDLITLVNITLNPGLKKDTSTSQPKRTQDSRAYDALVEELKLAKAPFRLKIPSLVFRVFKFAKLKLDKNYDNPELAINGQQGLIKAKGDALAAALAERENYPQAVLQKHLDSLSSENKESIEKQLNTIEKHASEAYCEYRKKAEALKAAKNAVVLEITQHRERTAIPIPLTLPEGDVHEDLQTIAAEYVAEANQIIEQTKANLEAVQAKIPTRFKRRNIDEKIQTVNTCQKEATGLINDEARQLKSLNTAYQQKVTEKVSALEKIAEEARKAQAAEEARRQEEAAAAAKREAERAEREQQNAEETARLEKARAAEVVRLSAVQETEEKAPTTVATTGDGTPSTPTSPETTIPAFRSLIVEEISPDEEMTITSPKRSKKQVAVMAAAVTGSILAGVGVTFLCALTLPASLPIIVAIAIGAATSLLIGAPSITASYCCLFKPSTHPGRNENALQPSLPRQS